MSSVNPIVTTQTNVLGSSSLDKKAKLDHNRITPSDDMVQCVSTYEIQKKSIFDSGWVKAGTLGVLVGTGLLISKKHSNQFQLFKEDLVNSLRAPQKTKSDEPSLQSVFRDIFVKIEEQGKLLNTQMVGITAELSRIREAFAEIPEDISKASIEERERFNDLYTRSVQLLSQLNRKSVSPKGRVSYPLFNAFGQELTLNLRASKKPMTQKTVQNIQNEIKNSLNGNYRTKEMDASEIRLLNISYEGTSGHKAGGQYDIATQHAGAMEEQGIATWNVGPAITCQKGNTRFGFAEENGRLVYKCPEKLKANPEKQKEGGVFVYEAKKVLDGVEIPENGAKMSVYYVPETKTFLLNDNKYFGDFGTEGNGNIYADMVNNAEKPRMAQFSNLVFEFIRCCKEEKIEIDGDDFIPNRAIMHEAWQSSGLLQKMKLLTHAKEADKSMSSDMAEWMREFADNSVVPIHNCGPGYQGPIGKNHCNDPHMIEEYIHNLYGDYAYDMMAALDLRNSGLANGRIHTLGFIRDYYNPASGAAILGRCGAVSAGYQDELSREFPDKKTIGMFTDELQPIFAKKANVLPEGLPNGVDRAEFRPTAQNLQPLQSKVQAVEGMEGKQVHSYIDENGNPLPYEEFVVKKKENEDLFLQLLKIQYDESKITEKNGVKSYPQTPIYKFSTVDALSSYTKFDISEAAEGTPIYSSISRLDDQKGISTTIEAYKELMLKWPKEDEAHRPILLFALRGLDLPRNAHFRKMFDDMEKELTAKGIKHRLIQTSGWLEPDSLMLINMTTRPLLPSDFEPYGISDLKGFYAGSHIIGTNVGGMSSANEGKVGQKVKAVFADKLTPETEITTQNSVIVGDGDPYTPFASLGGDERAEQIKKNSEQLYEALVADAKLTNAQRYRLDRNALDIDCSWNNGAAQNYAKALGAKIQQEEKSSFNNVVKKEQS